MSEFYCNEHNECINFVTDVNTWFQCLEIQQDELFDVKNKQHKHIFFFLEGSADVSYNEFPYKTFSAGEMIFLPKAADCKGKALTKCRVILLVYNNPIKFCGNTWLNAISTYAKNVKYEFKSLPINHVLSQYLDLLQQYLTDGINCLYLHEIKQKEFFLLLKAYYDKEDLAQFFYPMIGQSIPLRNKVMENYLSVRSVKELANICSYSERHFNTLFIDEFGEPPYQWMQKQKSKHILRRLSENDVRIKDIVIEFGFSCPSHFNKYCLKLFGDTPVHIRTKLSSENQYCSLKNSYSRDV